VITARLFSARPVTPIPEEDVMRDRIAVLAVLRELIKVSSLP
jgi:hypothetical protein